MYIVEMSRRRMNFEGNTNSKSIPRDIQRLYYCFTFFYINDKEVETLEIALKRISNYFLYGKEKCPTTEKKHLQGFIQLDKKRRFSQVKKLLPVSIHLEACKSNEKDNKDYCMKEGDWIEWHNPTSSNISVKRTYNLSEEENLCLSNIMSSGDTILHLPEQTDTFMMCLYHTHKCGFFVIKNIDSLKYLSKMKNNIIVIQYSFTVSADERYGIMGIIRRGHYMGNVFLHKYICFE